MSTPDNMRPLPHLWPALESVPGLRAVNREWRSLLQADFDIVQSCLVMTNEIATTYPAGDDGHPYQITQHGTDDFSACDPNGGHTVHLGRSDLSVLRFDLGRFAGLLKKAIGYTGHVEHLPGSSSGWRLGNLPVHAGGHPVFIACAMDSDRLCELLDCIASLHNRTPFLVLIPTRDNQNARVGACLERINGQLASCDEIFFANEIGELAVSAGTQSAICELFGAAPSGNIFKRNGDGGWTIAFEGNSSPDRHRKGFPYIAALLRDPGVPYDLPVLDELVTGIDARFTKGNSVPMSTKEATAEYETRIQDANQELAIAKRNNDIGQIESLQSEIFEIEKELTRVTGIRGKIRSTSELERMRKRVSRNIDSAIEAIGKFNEPLSIHLDRHIDRGLTLKYQPNDDRGWIAEFTNF